MIASETIAKLESLLARIQRRAAEPRAPKPASAPEMVAAKPPRRIVSTTPYETIARQQTPTPAPVRLEPIVAPIAEPPQPEPAHAFEAAAESAPLTPEPITPEPITPEPQTLQPIEVEPIALEPQHAEPAPVEEAAPESVSGEFAVAEMPLELEELGPADDLSPDETIVEVHVEPSEHETALQPPESGRELVATPHESARVPVAAPFTPTHEPIDLHEVSEPLHHAAAELHDLHDEAPADEHEAPPESQRNLRAQPSTPATSDIVDVEPLAAREVEEPAHEPPMPEEAPSQPIAVAAPFEPEPAHVEEQHVEEQHVEEQHVEEEPFEAAPIEAAPLEEAPVFEPPPPAAEPARRSEAPLEAEPAMPAEPIAFEPGEPASVAPATRISEVPVPPQRAAVGVALAASGAQARTEHVVVALDADVIRPEVTPADVAAIVGAARAPRPETFGVLLDAALDL